MRKKIVLILTTLLTSIVLTGCVAEVKYDTSSNMANDCINSIVINPTNEDVKINSVNREETDQQVIITIVYDKVKR